MNRLLKSYALCMALAMSFVFNIKANAQTSVVATLNHNGTLTSFYGINALVEAVAAADNGDIITLSGGLFNATTIDKAITVRGAGFDIDTSTSPVTKINGKMYVTTPAENPSNAQFVMEGIYTEYGLEFKSNVSKAKFIKCFFNSNQVFIIDSSAKDCDVEVIQCRIYDLRYSVTASEKGTIKCFNSSILNCYDRGYYENCNLMSLYPKYSTFINCAFFKPSNYLPIDATCSCVNGLAILADPTINIFSNLPSGGNNQTVGVDVLKCNTNPSFWGNPSSLELTDEAAATYLGTNGTQIGMYGGLMPFNPTPNTPQISRLSIAKKTNDEGKLSVDISVVAPN